MGVDYRGAVQKSLNSVDMAFPIHELVITMIYPQVLGIHHVHEPVIAPPAIRVNDRLKSHSTSDHSLQGYFLDTWNDFSIDLSVPLEDPEYDGLPKGSSAHFSLDPSGPEVGFVHFNLSLERRGLLTGFGDSFSDPRQVTIHRIPVEMSELRDLDGSEVMVSRRTIILNLASEILERMQYLFFLDITGL